MNRSEAISGLIVSFIILVAAAAFGGYYFGQKQGEKKGKEIAAASVQQTTPQNSSQLPAVTPVETLRNYLGNFFFDSNFISSGWSQSPSITQDLVTKINNDQRKQISIAKSLFCTEKLPQTVSFSPQPLSDSSTTAIVGTTETIPSSPDIKPSYSFKLNNGRWQIDQVTCP